MGNLSASNHARKLKKRLRRNHILQAFIEPHTSRQAEKLHQVSRNCYTNAVAELSREGYIKAYGFSDEPYNPIMWQAIKFDYREEGVDYDKEPTKIIVENKPKKPYLGLSEAVYSHNSDHEDLAKKYKAQNKQAREDKKSARVWAGIAEYA